MSHSSPRTVMVAKILVCLAISGVATPTNGQGCMNTASPCLTAIVNAASFESGAIAPGELVSLFGTGLGPAQGIQLQATLGTPFPTQAANVEVTFDGTRAPLVWVQATQINAVVPWLLVPGDTTQVCVIYNSIPGNCLDSAVAETSPAVFNSILTAALNQDGTPNSFNNPAPQGSIVSVWATGLGPITPPEADGALVSFSLPHNVLPVVITGIYQLGIPFPITSSMTFDVTYAGPAPGLVAGTSQVNFRTAKFPSNGMIYITLPSSQSPPFVIYIQ
jgi:uncharacterized protein (TIGR03437 family)